MANRFFNQFTYTLEKAPVTLWGNFTVGAAGAPTLVAGKSKGIKSVTRTSAGLYQIILADTYVSLLDFKCFVKSAALPAGYLQYVTSETVATAGTPSVNVQFAIAAGTATDPANGESIFFELKLKNSSAF